MTAQSQQVVAPTKVKLYTSVDSNLIELEFHLEEDARAIAQAFYDGTSTSVHEDSLHLVDSLG